MLCLRYNTRRVLNKTEANWIVATASWLRAIQVCHTSFWTDFTVLLLFHLKTTHSLSAPLPSRVSFVRSADGRCHQLKRIAPPSFFSLTISRSLSVCTVHFKRSQPANHPALLLPQHSTCNSRKTQHKLQHTTTRFKQNIRLLLLVRNSVSTLAPTTSKSC